MNTIKHDLERYSRQVVIKEIGEEGQKKLLRSKVLIIGAGGLGSSAALYCAAAGIGHMGIVDHDDVDLSNLNRQILHAFEDLGKPKTISARKRLHTLNPDIQVVCYQESIGVNNILGIIKGYDCIIDATDNFNSKFLINDACVMCKKAYVHAGVLAMHGQIFTYIPQAACLRCIFPQPPKGMVATSRSHGILGAAAGMAGSIQASEAIKFILGKGALLINRLLRFDLFSMEFSMHGFAINKACSRCQQTNTELNPQDYS
ncbi:MAG: adenylyltransferase [Elusimicrobia bacterium]|nr:adenylyltransferase [Elusimicrobiota bacterium]